MCGNGSMFLLFHLNTKWVKEVSKIFNVYLNNCQNASEVQMQNKCLWVNIGYIKDGIIWNKGETKEGIAKMEKQIMKL